MAVGPINQNPGPAPRIDARAARLAARLVNGPGLFFLLVKKRFRPGDFLGAPRLLFRTGIPDAIVTGRASVAP